MPKQPRNDWSMTVLLYVDPYMPIRDAPGWLAARGEDSRGRPSAVVPGDRETERAADEPAQPETGRQAAGRQAGRQAGGRAGRHAERQRDRETERQRARERD